MDDKVETEQTQKEEVYQTPTLTMMGRLIEETKGNSGTSNDGFVEAEDGTGSPGGRLFQ